MKHIPSPLFTVSVAFTVLCLSISSGCKSRGGSQPSNPFALDRQTAPPPATYSAQASYLGQTPGAVYSPQTPATPYNPAPASIPATIPNNAPLPSGAVVPTTTSPYTPGAYGSISGSGATTFQNAEATPIPLAAASAATPENGWTATVAPLPETRTEIVPSDTAETAFHYLETRQGTTVSVTNDGVARTMVAESDPFVVSSSQMITQIMDASAPEALPAEPKSMYAGQYQ